ncbi:putative protein kinase [Leptomonas pyrrhocoris]|uniref:Protein kinase domain-containing protein n=1 Tax=Leptomonas pyrrhocoris TaxID=157538 RepID=A0A0M9FUB0_LEPPY|nr:putative protein kinase [Leptomonas pyrrhocoris]KPA76016.1 putative protein kinase [Leptomonas pyrrhocoris]|eukprot:XP_015654455.1 putative protein kinase [Leptomonas pyrrhocoris]
MKDDTSRDAAATEGEQETVKRLFARPQRSISYSPLSSHASSLSSSLVFVGDEAADHTLPMDNDEEGLRGKQRATTTTTATATTKAPTSSRAEASLSSLSSSFDMSVFQDAQPPGSATADTPPPPPSLALQGQDDTVVFYSAQSRTEDDDSSHVQHSADVDLLGGPTKLDTALAWSSSSASLLPMVLSTNDAVGGVSETRDADGNADATRPARHGVTASPQPKAERATDIGGTTTTAHVLRPFAFSNVSPRSSAQQTHFTSPYREQDRQQQQQQHVPSSTGGHLRMGGSVGRTRSPSAPTGRFSYGWLKKVNAGVEVPPSEGAAAVKKFPAHPLAPYPPHRPPLLHSSPFSTPPTARLPLPLECTGERSGSSSSISHSGRSSPLRGRLREPPTWRSPQPPRFVTSLNVSPVSVWPSMWNSSARNNRDDRDGEIPSSYPLASQTNVLPAVTTITHATAVPALVASQRERSPSNSSASTAVLTQTFTQASAGAASANADVQAMTLMSPPPQPPSASLASPTARFTSRAEATRPGPSEVASRSSTQLITKAAATRPTASPVTMWICLDEEEEEEEGEEEDTAMAGQRGVAAAAPADVRAAVSTRSYPPRTQMKYDNEQTRVDIKREGQRQPSPLRRRATEKSHPIADILSPTFRPRRRATQPFASQTRSVRVDDYAARPNGDARPRFSSQLDDDEDDEGDGVEAGETPPRKRARLSSVAPPFPGASVDVLSKDADGSAPRIIADGDDAEEQAHEQLPMEADAFERKGDLAAAAQAPRVKRVPARRLSTPLRSGSEESEGNSPLKPTVKDLFFPERLDPELRPCSPFNESIHAYQQHYQQQQQQDAELHTRNTGDSVAGVRDAMQYVPEAAEGTKTTTKRGATATMHRPGHKRARTSPTRRENGTVVPPALPDWGRPADAILRDFFPIKPTKKVFMAAAQTVMSPQHFLEPKDFWQAFAAAEFVGEGSFGLVWRCRTVDGDLVAVKSCPINLHTRANIEDSFSTIREIATMRFLNEMQVPYVLPLHSAFFVKAAEALPPLAQEALAWRQQLRKQAEAAVLEKEVVRLGKGHGQLSRRGGGRGGYQKSRRGGVTAAPASAAAPLTFEQQVTAEMECQAAAETRAERAVRARLERVRLPRFLSITEDDLRQSDATAFLVMELCDGDVEGIPRSDGVAKGVVYCVSSALAAMHELGLLHLDLKPSNVLFAYEHGPSQSSPPAPSHTNMDAVKFYLSDFGNCRLVGPDPLDEVAESFGTFEYMDLRALQDAVCGRPTDAFSLGATLYELLYGKRLYPKCKNPKCAEEDDHSRECFVEMAKRPVVLPTTITTATTSAATTTTALPLLQPRPAAAGPPDRPAVAADATAAPFLRPSHPRGKKRKPAPATRNKDSSSISNNSGSETLQSARSTAAAVAAAALTPLQSLTLALLRQKWADRATAAECRRYLIDTFHITQADEEEEV